MSKQVMNAGTKGYDTVAVSNSHKKVVLSPQAKAKKREYDKAYARKYFKGKYIPFNIQYPKDIEMLEWIQKQDNGTQYIKRLIMEDLERTKRKEVADDGI